MLQFDPFSIRGSLIQVRVTELLSLAQDVLISGSGGLACQLHAADPIS